MNETIERIKELIRVKRTSLNAIASGDKALQVKLSRQINNGANLSNEIVNMFLSKFPDVSSEWLLRGEGEMYRTNEPNRPINLGESTYQLGQIDPSHADIITHPIEGTTARPYYDVDFIGGFDLMMNDQTTNPTYLIDCSPYNKEGVIWCNLSGHSMEPAINHGDIIALREVQDWRTFLSFGEIYGIVTDNDLRTVKIIRKGSDSEHFRLVPINTAEYDEQEIPTAHISRIFQILGSIKKF